MRSLLWMLSSSKFCVTAKKTCSQVHKRRCKINVSFTLQDKRGRKNGVPFSNHHPSNIPWPLVGVRLVASTALLEVPLLPRRSCDSNAALSPLPFSIVLSVFLSCHLSFYIASLQSAGQCSEGKITGHTLT